MRANLMISSLILGAIVAGCSKKPEAPAPESPLSNSTASTPDVRIDACSLLTSEEIQAVQGEAVKETKANRTVEGGVVVSQCFFSLPTFANSITIRLVQRGEGEQAQDPRRVWQETFARDLEKAMKERNEGRAPPERVAGVGDEAFWMGGSKAGGLYVLKGNRYFRLGFGGEPNQAEKIDKAKKLAASILSRL